MTGSAIAVAGAAMCSLALWLGSFALFCLGTAVIGIYTAFGLQYRFAAAEVAAPEFRAKAISRGLRAACRSFLALMPACGQGLLPVRFLSRSCPLAIARRSRVHRIARTAARGRDPRRSRPLARIAPSAVFHCPRRVRAGYGIMTW